MSKDQRKKMLILMINMFIAVGSFGIIIPILPAYLLSIGQGGTAAGLNDCHICRSTAYLCRQLQGNGQIDMDVE